MSTRKKYDKDLINQSLMRIVESYLGPPQRSEGVRNIYRCPTCHSEDFQANPEYETGPIIGCFKDKCAANRVMDSIEFVALMEDLNTSRDFAKICQQAARVVPECVLDAGTANGSVNGDGSQPHPANSTTKPPSQDSKVAEGPDGSAMGGNASSMAASQDPHGQSNWRQFRHEVLTDLLNECPMHPDAFQFLYDRGLEKDTILDGRFGYFRADKGNQVVKTLLAKYQKSILEAPGFSKGEQKGKLRFTFLGHNWLLIPYYDSEGYLANIEGRIMPAEEHQVKQKYIALRGSGSHLYLFPGFDFNKIEAFCEGVFGAIIAAQQGIAVASIQGFRRYRQSGGTDVLEQLKTVDLGKQKICFIPDVDDPPKDEVLDAAPEAARWLIERQNGVPAIALLPEGKDLDEYLLAMEPARQVKALRTLIKGSIPLEAYERKRQKDKSSRDTGAEDATCQQRLQAEGPADDQLLTPEPEPDPGENEDPRDASGQTQDQDRANQPPDQEYPAVDAKDIDGENEVLRRFRPSRGEDRNRGGPGDHEAHDQTDAVSNEKSAHATGAGPRTRPSVRESAKRFARWVRNKKNSEVEQLSPQDSAERIIRGLRLSVKLLFIFVGALLLYPLMSVPVTALVPLTGILLTAITFATSASVPALILYYVHWRRRRHQTFLEGKWVPGAPRKWWRKKK